MSAPNFNPGVNWIRNVSTLDGRRDIKSRTTWYDVNKPVNGGVARTLEEFDTFNENNKVSTISYFDAQDRITLKREIFDNGDIATTNYNYNTSLRYNRLTAAYESVAADPSSGAQPQTAAINTSETGHQNLLYRTNLVQRFEAFRNRDRNVYRPIVEGIFNVVGNIRERITGFYRSSEEERVGYDIQFRAGDAGGGDIGDRIRARLEAAEDLLSRIREFRARAAEPNPVETPPSDAQLIPYIPQRISVGTLIDFVSITDTFNKSGAWTNRRLDLRNGNAFEIASTDGASANVPWTETLIDADGNEVFARATDYFNERARLYKTIEIFDDGTRAETLYEQNNEWVGYSDYTNYYDLDNRFVRQIGRADNGNYWENRWANGYGNAGERSESVLDFNGDESFSSRTNYFNSSGLNYRQTGVRDDGDSWDYSFAARGLATSRTELDTNSDATWASRKSDYNDQGQVTTLTEINDDGTRAVTTYDLANALSYASITNYYDTQNRIVRQYRLLDNGNAQETIWPNGHGKPGPYSVILHDLKNLDASYSTYTLNYNADGKLVKQTLLRDNGQIDEYVLDPVTGKRTSWTVIDANGSETWASRKSDYNDQGQVTTLTEINDDGTRAVTTYDVANAQVYVSVTSYYDTQNRLVRQYRPLDNGNAQETIWPNGHGKPGPYSVILHDLKNLDASYRTYTLNYNVDGKLVKQTLLRDNGQTDEYVLDPVTGKRTSWTVIDTNSDATWASRKSDYNDQGQVTTLTEINDDGTRAVTTYDLANAQAYNWITRYYDTQNRLVRQYRLLDTGNAHEELWPNGHGQPGPYSVILHDLKNLEASYRTYTLNYNVDGKLVKQTFVRDNGQTDEYVLDPVTGKRTSWIALDTNGSETWTSRKSDYNDQGQVTTLTQINDDGTRAVTTYDVANAQAYVSVTSYYDTQNRLVRQTGLQDNGNFWERQWDNGYGNGGAQSTSYIDANNDEWYASYTNSYDASGQKIVRQTGVSDNGDTWQWIWENGFGNAGNAERIDWDTSGTKPWWQQVADYNAANQLTSFETYYDDKSKVVDNFSNDANVGWTKRTDTFNAAGVLSSQTYT